MKQFFLAIMLLVSVAALCQSTHVDTAVSTIKDIEQEFDDAVVPESYKEKLSSGQSYTDSISLNNIKLNEEVFRYTFDQNRKVFQWQYLSSIIIFFVVILIVLMGLLLSYLQFKKAAESSTKLELGSAGIKIDTAVIGLVILTLSLSFLFLYLKYVYPISIVKIK